MSNEIDALIARVIDWDTPAEEALIAAGPAGARRVFDLHYGKATLTVKPKATNHSMLVDGWAAVLYIAATVLPEEFLTRLPRHIGTTEIGILGDIDDPRATDILCRQARHRDWLHRSNAISALAKHPGAASRAAIERALGDRELLVRSQAIAIIAESDPSRGVTLYEALAREPRLSPLMRRGTQSALSALRERLRDVDG
jgi:hypothetical protein